MKWMFAPLALLTACSSSPEHLIAPSSSEDLNIWSTQQGIPTLFGSSPSIKTEQDDGCAVIRIRNSDTTTSPQAGADLKCNRIALFWTQYEEPGFEEKNKAVRQIAEHAAIRITGSPDLVDHLMKGDVLRNEATPSGFSASGSCTQSICLITLKAQ